MKAPKCVAACCAALSLLIAGCSPSERDSATASQPGASQTADVADTAIAQEFEPQYIGGYPTEETAEVMLEEYDYQAAVQFYIWAYPYVNSLGWEKGCAEMGGDERSIYHWDKRVQSQHVVMTVWTA